MLSFSPIEKPKIDIELYGTDINIAPIDKVHIMDEDTLISSFQFDVLKEEIYNGIIDVHEQDYSTGYKRLVADLQQAAITNTSKSLLDSKLHCIGNCERKGVCHMLVNDCRIKWVKTK